MEREPTLELIDEEDAGRTTATLLGSLSARLASLYVISGADAIGSLTAGFAAYGREVARTAWGARMRRALETSRAGSNGDAIWKTLRIADWASTIPPTPVVQQMRNDMALIAAEDVAEMIAALPIPAQTQGARGLPPTIEANFLDFTLGLWAYAKETAKLIEALAAPTMDDGRPVVPERDDEPPPASGPMLR
jgi:hypothetical protein